jgi:hypothetical protein
MVHGYEVDIIGPELGEEVVRVFSDSQRVKIGGRLAEIA